jgi:hypothetical protein
MLAVQACAASPHRRLAPSASPIHLSSSYQPAQFQVARSGRVTHSYLACPAQAAGSRWAPCSPEGSFDFKLLDIPWAAVADPRTLKRPPCGHLRTTSPPVPEHVQTRRKQTCGQ